MSLNIMLPIFLMIVLGVVLRKVGIFPKTAVKDLNKLVFNCFLPIMLFNNVRMTDFRQVFDGKLIGFAIATAVSMFVLFVWAVPKFVKDPRQQSVAVQGLYRSNYVILGIPVVRNIYQGESIAVITMLVAVIVPMFNLMAVYVFEHFNGEGRHDIGKMLKNIAKNPLIIGTLLGFGYTVAGIHFPSFLETTLMDLSAVTIPLALLILGADLNFDLKGTGAKILVAVVTSRLFVIPAVCLTLAVFCGFRGQPLASLMAMYASPAAVSGYIMAQNAGADSQLAGQIVVVTSVLACFTLFLWIALLLQLQLI